MTYLMAHWKPMLIAAAVAGAAGWLAHRPPEPAVHAVSSETTAAATQAKTDQTVQAGPVKVVQTVEEFGDGTGPGATPVVSPAQRESPAGTTAVVPGRPATGRLLRRTITVTEQGPTTTETHVASQATSAAARSLDLTITPQTRPGWALQVGFEDLLGSRYLRAAARRRLLGPVWVEVSAVPARRALGAAVAFEW